MIRRAIDVVVASAVLVLASPLLAAAAIAIRLTSRGPAIYRQRRVGLHGREFDVLKLRTMVAGAERLGPGLAVDEGDRGSPAWARCCDAARLTSCPISGTSCAARCR